MDLCGEARHIGEDDLEYGVGGRSIVSASEDREHRARDATADLLRQPAPTGCNGGHGLVAGELPQQRELTEPARSL